MRQPAVPLVLWATLALGALPATAGAAKIKCWTNDQGVRECGNVVPPRYSQREHETVNRHGVTVATQERAKTPAELEAEARAEAEAERRAEEKARRAEMQAARDRVLLDTFTTEDDLVLAHQGRLAAIDSRVKHTRQVMATLTAELIRLQGEAAEQERSGQPVADKLREEIARIQQQLDDNRQFIRDRAAEKVELDEQFQLDLERYRELQASRPAD